MDYIQRDARVRRLHAFVCLSLRERSGFLDMSLYVLIHFNSTVKHARPHWKSATILRRCDSAICRAPPAQNSTATLISSASSSLPYRPSKPGGAASNLPRDLYFTTMANRTEQDEKATSENFLRLKSRKYLRRQLCPCLKNYYLDANSLILHSPTVVASHYVRNLM